MRYPGSKRRIVQYLHPIILDGREKNQCYVEPFVGGCNSIQDVANPRLASDINPYLIALYEGLQNGWTPPKKRVTEKQYKEILGAKDRSKWDSAHVGYVLQCCSFRGVPGGGYAEKLGDRDWIKEQNLSLIKLTPKLTGIKFFNCHYTALKIPKNSIIYCDPPYKSTRGYRCKFNHSLFWAWVRMMVQTGFKVYVSELQAPHDFKEVWSMDIKCSLAGGRTKVFKEKLFIYNG